MAASAAVVSEAVAVAASRPRPEPLDSARQVEAQLRALGDPVRAEHSQRFFRTGKGEYGEGDRFLGIRVPEQRKVARRARALPLKDER